MNISNEVKDKLSSYGVSSLILFGSYATGTTTKLSDYDIGIILDTKGFIARNKNYHEYYTKLYDVLTDCFSEKNGIDIVFLDTAPLELRKHIALYGKSLMGSTSEKTVADFNAQTTLLYADFEPYRTTFHQSLLSNL